MTERPKPPTTETLPNDPADTEGHSQDALDGFDTQQDLTPTPSPEEQHDQEVRFTDAEILGKSFKVRLAINEGVTATLNEHKMARAEGYNKLSTPKNKFLERRYEAAEDKYQRKLAKVGSSRWKFINNHHQNAANHDHSHRERPKRDLPLSHQLRGCVQMAAILACAFSVGHDHRANQILFEDTGLHRYRIE